VASELAHLRGFLVIAASSRQICSVAAAAAAAANYCRESAAPGIRWSSMPWLYQLFLLS
jgi:hypothetical protein